MTKTKTKTRKAKPTTPAPKSYERKKPAKRPVTFGPPQPVKPRSYDKKVSILPPITQAPAMAVTPAEYSGIQTAFDFFNAELFDGALKNVFITYQRRAHSAGHFAANRYADRSGDAQYHEISLNPDVFIGHTDEQNLQTVVHEMTHEWQREFGKDKPSRSYHNKEWAAKMISIGLMPSNTGAVGGKITGVHMSDYIIPDGPFTKAYKKLAASGWRLNLQSAIRLGPRAKPDGSKTKFTCKQCDQNSWGKPDLGVLCEYCLVAAAREDGFSDDDIAKLTRFKMRDIRGQQQEDQSESDAHSYERARCQPSGL